MKTTVYGVATALSLFTIATQINNFKEKLIDHRSSSHKTDSIKKSYPTTIPFGVIYSKNNWVSTNDFITNGNVTASLNNNYVNISSASSDDWNNTVYITNYQTKLEKWEFKLRFRIAAWSANSYGLGFGLKSANQHVQNDVMGFLQTTNSGIGGLYILKSNRTIMAIGSNSLNIALNDVIDMEGEFYDSVFHFTAKNVTSGASANVSYTFASNGTTEVVPNTSYFSLMELGGTHEVQNIEIGSEELTRANLVTVGDSKTIGYFSNSFAGRYAAQLNNNYPDALINAGGADAVTNVLNRKDELIRLNANKYLLSIGSNDMRYGASLNELQTNYDSLVSILQATGATLYHIVLPEDYTKPLGVNLLTFKNWVASAYPSTYIDVWDSMATNNVLKGIYDFGDGVHLNQAGNDKIYEAIVASNKLNNIVLPVKLLTFSTKKINNNTAEIIWIATYDQPEKYELLKSKNGRDYELLFSQKSIPGASYRYIDKDLFPGTNYYQLRMTEHTGPESYSETITVQNEQPQLSFGGYQKSNAGELVYNINTAESILINWEIIDESGRKIKYGIQQLQKGTNMNAVKIADLNRGYYYLRIIPCCKEQTITSPFIK